MNHPSIGRDRVRAYGAGLRPRPSPHPMALVVLASHGYAVGEPR